MFEFFTAIMTANILFWVVFLPISILIILFIENDNGWGPLGVLIITGVLWWIVDGHEFPTFLGVLTWLNLYWLKCLLYIVLYLFIGVIWSMGKWYFYLSNLAENLKNSYPGALAENWKRQSGVSYNKDRLINWMTYWPWSMTWTLLNDPIRRAYRFIYSKLTTVYQAIADHVYRSIMK